MRRYRPLSAAHFLIAIPLIVFAALGAALAPLILLLPLWLGFVGLRLWRGPRPGIQTMVRRTHYAVLLLAGLLCIYGVTAMQAAERSAAHGGGLLGAFGLIPLTIGILLAALSIASLVIVR